MPHALLRHLTQHNPRMVRGEGIYLFDAAGKRYLDGSSGSSLVCNLGHGEAAVAEAIARQAAVLAYNPFHCSHAEAYLELAEKLVGIAPPGFGRVFAVSSGSEAVENCLKFSRQAHLACGEPGRHLVIGRWQSYHGNTLGALACGGHTGRRKKHVPQLAAAVHIPPAFCYRCPFEKTHPSCGLLCARALESAIHRLGPENVAAFIAEPVVGAALGAVPAPPGYFELVREICTRHGIHFIADEVMCGLGRTGRHFAIDHWGVAPDLIATGKGLGAGYFPMAACLIADGLAAAVEGRGAAFEGVHTCCGHLLGSRVGGLMLERLVERRLAENAARQGARLLSGLREIAGRRPAVGDVRGLGLMAGVEFVRDRETRAPYPPGLRLAERVMDACLERGLIVYPGHGTVEGVAGDHLLLGPPLIIGEEGVDELLAILEEAIAAVERDPEVAALSR